MGGERSDDREAVSFRSALGNLASCVGLRKNTKGEAASLNGISPEC